MPIPALLGHAEVVRVIHSPEARKLLLNDGLEPVGNTPQEFGAIVREELARWPKVATAVECGADAPAQCRDRRLRRGRCGSGDAACVDAREARGIEARHDRRDVVRDREQVEPAGQGVEGEPLRLGGARQCRECGRCVVRRGEAEAWPFQLLELGEHREQLLGRCVSHALARGAEPLVRASDLLFHPRGVALERDHDGEVVRTGEHRVACRHRAADDRECGGLPARERRPRRGVRNLRRPHRINKCGACLGCRGELEARFEEDAQAAPRAAQQTVDRVAGDVLHHPAARARERAVAEREACAEHAIAR